MAKQKSIPLAFWRFCAIGLTVSVGMAVLYAAGVIRQPEAWMLDLRFRLTNDQLKQSDQIRLIAIDDQSLTQVGRWPWPRKHVANLIDALKEVGAARVALDLHFPEAQRVIELDATQPDGSSQAVPVQYDTMFAEAIQRAGNVYLPIVCEAISGDIDLQAAQRIAQQLVRQDQPLTDGQFSEKVGVPAWLLGEDAYLRSRIAGQLRQRFWLSEDQVAEQLHTPVERVSNLIGTVKRQVALELVSEYVQEDAEATPETIAQKILKTPGAPAGMDLAELRWAVEQVHARQLVRNRLISWPDNIPAERKTELMQAADSFAVQVPIEPLAAHAAGFGHVVIPPETDGLRWLRESDGVIRRLPVLLRWDGKLIPQMGVRLAGDMLGYDWQRMWVEPGQVVIPTKDGHTVHIPLDDTGQTLLNWYRPGNQWQMCFDGPVPAGAVLEIAQWRQTIRQNEAWWQTRLLRMVQLIQPAELARYEQLREQAEQIEQRLQAHRPASQPAPKEYRNLQDQLERLRTGEMRIRTACIDLLRQEGPDLPTAIQQEKDPKQQEQLKEYLALYGDIAQGKLRDHINQVNARLARQIEARKAGLAGKLAGKTCLVGYTASALADVVSTPIWTVAPGMMTHAQLLNSLLQDRLIWPVSTAVNTAIVLLCCVVMTLVTSAQGPRASLVSMIAACLVYAFIASYVLFQYASLDIALATPLIGMFVTWAMITSYRELTEERAKRRFARTLQQYTSPAIARQMAENPGVVTKAETREVTCFFSDLKGFTSISEKIGAEATQQILNVYLDRMTEVLDHHEALINKFLGDGIFAFFNPAIHPQPDHARRACIASLEAMEALERLKRQADAEQYKALQMRIGVASGMAVVGNCGSERKFDYTCIGDTVNLASRLEGANKTFGTGALINSRCKQLLPDGFHLRHIGRVLVVGRAMYEDTYELVGRTGLLDAQTCESIDCFEQAVRCFIAGNLEKAKTGFEQCCSCRPTDTAAWYYLGLCEAYMKRELPANWAGTIELVGK